MTAIRSYRFWSLFIMFTGLTACPAKPTDPKPDSVVAADECFEDSDCPDSQLFFCNTTTSTCEPSCRTKADCTADVRGEYALAYCDGNLGCQCDEGRCVGSLCSSDLDCGSQVCRNGACVDAPAASSVTACQISPDFVVLTPGSKAKFWVSTWAGTEPVVTKTGATWAAAGSTVTGGGSGASAEFTAAATTSAVGPLDVITATVGGVTCKAQAIVLPLPNASDAVNVVVLDELSRRPISGAKVVASSLAGVTLDDANTDARGFGSLTIPGGNSRVSVSAFHPDYNYLTIGAYDMTSSSPAARFLSLVVRRNQVDKYGGYKGTFNNVPATANVHAGIAGASLAGSIVDLSVAQLLGPSVPTDVVIGTSINEQDVPIPAGTYLGFTSTVIKSDISAQGLAGVCYTSAGVPDETAIANGTCGTRTAWALSGDVPLGDLPIDAFTGGTENLDFGKLLGRIVPVFKKFNSSVVRDVEFTLKSTPTANGSPDFSDTSHFKTVNHEFAQVPLAFSFAVKTPDLPKLRGSFADGVLLLGGASVQGRGVVPLGLGAAVNTNPADAKTDIQSGLSSAGLVSMRMAPTHHGLEGSEYGVISLAVSLKSATDASVGLATSAIYGRVPGNQLQFDPTGTKTVDLPGAYPAYPENAKYNFSDMMRGSLVARTFAFSDAPDFTGVSLIRVVFNDKNSRTWVVYIDPSRAEAGLTLPTPPTGYSDRTFGEGTSASGRSSMYVQTLRLQENPLNATGGLISFNEFVEHNSFNGDRFADFTTGFALYDYGIPRVEWVTPAAEGETVAPGSKVKMAVKLFRVGNSPGDDGFVRVTFDQLGCTPVDGTVASTDGKNEVSINLPTGCSGSNITMVATLHDANGPLDPGVSSSVKVNIQ